MKQIQLFLHWPDRGFKRDTIRLSSLEWDEWEGLQELVRGDPGQFPILSRILEEETPISVPHADLGRLKEECDNATDPDQFDDPAMSALSSISLLLMQASKQREPGIQFDYCEGAYFENFVLIPGGVDLLQDLEELDQRQ